MGALGLLERPLRDPVESVGEHGVVIGLGDVEANLGTRRHLPDLGGATGAGCGSGLGKPASAGEYGIGSGQPGAVRVCTAEWNLSRFVVGAGRGVGGESADAVELAPKGAVVRGERGERGFSDAAGVERVAACLFGPGAGDDELVAPRLRPCPRLGERESSGALLTARTGTGEGQRGDESEKS